MNNSINLHFYGLNLGLQSHDAEVVDSIRLDFSYFQTESSNTDVKITVFNEAPPYDELPNLCAAFYTPRNVCYRKNETTYIDYSGKALSIYNSKKKTCYIYGKNKHLIHEISYLCILSIVGQFLDSKKIHRVHALGVSRRGKAILILLPIGGGKTTLALEFLKSKDVKLLSEDTPLITPQGKILPFPLRIGVQLGQNIDVPQKYIRRIERMEYGPKTLIDIGYFYDRIGTISEPGIIIVGERTLGTQSKIEPLSKLKAVNAFVKNAVVGLGIYQGLEFLLEKGTWEILNKSGLAFSRFKNSLKIINRSKLYRFIIGRDRQKNYNTLLDFIKRKIPG